MKIKIFLEQKVKLSILLKIRLHLNTFRCLKNQSLKEKVSNLVVKISVKSINNEIQIDFTLIDNNFIKVYLHFIKHYSLMLYDNLIDICAIDLLNLVDKHNKIKEDLQARFKLVYVISSYKYDNYIYIGNFIKQSDSNHFALQSITQIFFSANWIEREVWEMYGIFFLDHPDLRRLLTDYSFSGYPLRKDYPLSGYIEVRYDDSLNCIVYEPLVLAQAYRSFNFHNPWISK